MQVYPSWCPRLLSKVFKTQWFQPRVEVFTANGLHGLPPTKPVPIETDYTVNQLTLLAGQHRRPRLNRGHKQALRHASETPLSSERVQYRAPCRCAPRSYGHTHTHTHTRETGKATPSHL